MSTMYLCMIDFYQCVLCLCLHHYFYLCVPQINSFDHNYDIDSTYMENESTVR